MRKGPTTISKFIRADGKSADDTAIEKPST
jgi:hypothetical protein